MKINYRLLAILSFFLISAYAMYSITFVLIPISLFFHVSVSIVTLAITLSWIGGAIGGFVFGIIADKIGRKKAILVSAIIYSLGTLTAGFINDIYELYFLWFLVGIGVNGENGISYALVSEFENTLHRGMTGGFMQGLYAIGSLLGAFSAYIIIERLSLNFRAFFIIIGIISLISLTFWNRIPESNMWLKHKNSLNNKIEINKIFTGHSRNITIFGSLISLGSFLFIIPLFSLAPTELENLNIYNYYIIIIMGTFAATIFYTLSGYMYERRGAKDVMYPFAVMSLLFSLIFIFINLSGSLRLLNEVFLVLLFISSSFFSFFGIWISSLYPPNIRASGANFTLLVGRFIGGGFGPIITVIIGKNLGFNLGIILFISSIIVILGLVFIRPGSMEKMNNT